MREDEYIIPIEFPVVPSAHVWEAIDEMISYWDRIDEQENKK